MRTQILKQFIGLKFIIILLVLSVSLIGGNVWAETFEEMYGPELKSVPYAYRVRYSNEYDKAWSEATYDERLAFLQEIYQQELDERMAQQNEDNQEFLIENQKAIEREAKKMAEQQKKIDKQMKKDNEKMQEEFKKYERQRKSMDQQQKIFNMRNNQRK